MYIGTNVHYEPVASISLPRSIQCSYGYHVLKRGTSCGNGASLATITVATCTFYMTSQSACLVILYGSSERTKSY